MIWTIASIFFVLIAGIAVFLLWNSSSSRQSGTLTLSDFINLLIAFLTFVGLAVAFNSLQVANQAYQKSVQDGLEQQKILDASRVQLQAVVDAAIKQQDILDRNLETSKAQQVLLNKSLEISKHQQEIQHKTLETSKAQLGVLEEQQKREAERLARKPIAEIFLVTNDGPTPLDIIEKLPAVTFPVEQGKDWARLSFHVLNKGKIEISRPVVRIVASPETVFIDRADQRVGERADHNALQFSGPTTIDIEPEEVAGGAVRYVVDIRVPDLINDFDLKFSITGKNLPLKEHILHLMVIRHPS